MPLLVILGPTATGKTFVSVELSRELKGEIISADSMLIYRHMNIGTAKPTPEEMKGVPHHMIDIAEPDENFSVARYANMVQALIPSIIERGNLPVMAGGTGLYIRAVTEGYHCNSVGADDLFRNQMTELCRERGNIFLHRQLMNIDTVTASRLHPNDTKRIIRALEVYQKTGIPLSKQSQADNSPGNQYKNLFIGLTMERKLLYRRIEDRVDAMLAQGLVEEVDGLIKRGFSPGCTAMQGLGYKEIYLYLQGSISLDEAGDLIKMRTRRYAKRQLTWYNRDRRINWFDVGNREIGVVIHEITSMAAGVSGALSNTNKRKKTEVIQ